MLDGNRPIIYFKLILHSAMFYSSLPTCHQIYSEICCMVRHQSTSTIGLPNTRREAKDIYCKSTSKTIDFGDEILSNSPGMWASSRQTLRLFETDKILLNPSNIQSHHITSTSQSLLLGDGDEQITSSWVDIVFYKILQWSTYFYHQTFSVILSPWLGTAGWRRFEAPPVKHWQRNRCATRRARNIRKHWRRVNASMEWKLPNISRLGIYSVYWIGTIYGSFL